MSNKIFVVTGANKGIGYGIVRGLAKQVQGATIYLTARNVALGEEALKKLDAELSGSAGSQLLFHELDITDRASCDNFARHLGERHGGLDVLVNNAGMAFKRNAVEPPGLQADVTIDVNYYGTRRVSDALIPLIRAGGRIVNVCSSSGIMAGLYKKELIDQFDRPDFATADIDNFVEDYKKFAHENRRKEGGYPESAYAVSKAAEIALSVLQARQLQARGIVVNACCPGYVDTDMTSHKGHLSIDQGADTPIWLAIGADVPNGKFVYRREAKDWLH